MVTARCKASSIAVQPELVRAVNENKGHRWVTESIG